VRGSLRSQKLLEVLKLPNTSLFNLSGIKLTEVQQVVLGLGLKFLPMTCECTANLITSLTKSLDDFCYRLRLAIFFKNQDNNKPLYPRRLVQNFDPKTDVDPIIEKYRQECSLKIHQTSWCNDLPPIQRLLQSTLREIYLNNDWIIKPADKNLGTCIMSKADYITMCMLHLSDITSYLPYLGDAVSSKNEFIKLKQLFERHSSFMYKKDSIGMSPLYLSLMQLHGSKDLKVSKFYCLPKMHKLIPANTPTPGRPIVSSIKAATYMTSKYLHNYFYPIVMVLIGICLSAIDVLHAIEKLAVLPPDCVILCADVKSLYPSIPITYGLAAVRAQLLDRNHCSTPSELDFHLDLLAWVLENNIFEFNGQFYKQIHGTAMGTPVAVSYANLVLSYLERDCLDLKPILYMRYIDDLFVICKDRQQALDIVNLFNSKCPSIQLDAVTIDNHGVFLDLDLRISDGKIITKIFQKEMNRYLYIPPTSLHSIKSLAEFIKQEIKRYRLHCYLDNDFFEVKQLFYTRLRQRGFSVSFLEPIFAIQYDRNSLLLATYKRKQTTPLPKAVIVLRVPRLIKPINLHQLFALPQELLSCRLYKGVYGNNDLVIGKKNYPSIGLQLAYKTIYPAINQSNTVLDPIPNSIIRITRSTTQDESDSPREKRIRK
jgi:hypothetical protein